MCSKKRAVLFANGDFAGGDWLTGLLKPDDFLIAVDGGYDHAKKTGYSPDLLVGDLDSLEHDPTLVSQAGTEIIRFPREKDETDLELALQVAVSRKFNRILVIGALGGRLDQSLANLFLLANPDYKDCDICFESGAEEVFLIRDSRKIDGSAGETVSLLPLGKPVEGIYTEGLQYPLTGETLYPDRTRGISNVMLGTQARVSIDHGKLLCIHLRTKLF